MKITAIKASWLHVPIPEEKASVSDFGRNISFNTTLVRMETDGGLIGYGEAAELPRASASPPLPRPISWAWPRTCGVAH